jgi:hypothetical protein
MLFTGLWLRYINITITGLHITHSKIFYLEHVSGDKRLALSTGPNWMGPTSGRTCNPVSETVSINKRKKIANEECRLLGWYPVWRYFPPKRRFLHTRRKIPEDAILHSHRRKNLKL